MTVVELENLAWVGNAETLPTSLTVEELEGSRNQRTFEWREKHLRGVLHGMQWILNQAQLEEVGLTQNWETLTPQILTTLELLYLIV